MNAPIKSDQAVVGLDAGQGALDAMDCVSMPGVEFNMPMPPSVNELYRNKPGRGRVKTAKYFDYVAMGMAAIRRQKIDPIPGRVLIVLGVERNSLSADIDNRLKATFDTIVKAGVIEDDRFITGHAVAWLPKANGLAWIKVLPVQRVTLEFQPSPDGACGGWFVSAPQPREGGHDGNLTQQP